MNHTANIRSPTVNGNSCFKIYFDNPQNYSLLTFNIKVCMLYNYFMCHRSIALSMDPSLAKPTLDSATIGRFCKHWSIYLLYRLIVNGSGNNGYFKDYARSGSLLPGKRTICCCKFDATPTELEPKSALCKHKMWTVYVKR